MLIEKLSAYDDWVGRWRFSENHRFVGINEGRDGRFIVFRITGFPRGSRSEWCDGLLSAQALAVEWLVDEG